MLCHRRLRSGYTMSRDQEEKEKPKRDNTRNLKALLGASLVVNVVLIISVSTDTMSIGTVATRSFIKTGSDSCGPSSKLLGGEAEAVVDSVTVEGHKSVPIKDPHLQAVLRGCGEVCRYDTPRQPSKYFDYIEAKPVNCPALMSNEAIDAPSNRTEPLATIPDDMLDFYTYGGKVPVETWTLNAVYLGKAAMTPVWTRELVEEWMTLCKHDQLPGSYGIPFTSVVYRGLQAMNLAGASVLVIGSEQPWLEACALAAGASKITTLEYGAIESKHPKISTLTPAAMRANYQHYQEAFDAVLSYSSVEHSGLGRYGDALNPWGDRQAIARAWCMTKPGGKLGIGVVWGSDKVVYNAHRVYGPIMYPHLVANWKQLDKFDVPAAPDSWENQPFLVLEKS